MHHTYHEDLPGSSVLVAPLQMNQKLFSSSFSVFAKMIRRVMRSLAPYGKAAKAETNDNYAFFHSHISKRSTTYSKD